MTPDQAAGLLQFLQPQILQEFESTRRVLAAVPDEKAEYKPHPTCMSAQELATHIVGSEIWFLESIVSGEFREPDETPFKSMKPSEARAFYEEKVPQLAGQLNSLSSEQLARDTQFFMFNLPLVAYLQFCQKHSIHHRGQLAVYLRPMGAKVPSIYGGSADEPMTAATQA